MKNDAQLQGGQSHEDNSISVCASYLLRMLCRLLCSMQLGEQRLLLLLLLLQLQ